MYRFVKSIFCSLLFILALSSCGKDDKVMVAEAAGKFLYLSDIPDIFPEGTSTEDSLTLFKTYINSWVRKQVVLVRAEQNLSEEMKDVNHQLDEYRTSLLTYRYEQEFVNQHLDTLVTADEIEAFYQANKDKLRLPNPLVRAVFIKIVSTSPYLKKIKDIYRSTSSDKAKELDDLCIQAAEKYDYFSDEWTDFSNITKLLPKAAAVYEVQAQSQGYIEDKDDKYTYLVNIKEFIPRGGVAPVGYQKKVITSIILNNRKQKMISELEQRIYDDAVSADQVKITIPEQLMLK